MRLGWVVPQNEIGTDPDDIGRWAQAVQELGFSYLDIFDHVVHRVAELLRGELAAPVVNQRASVRHYPRPDV